MQQREVFKPWVEYLTVPTLRARQLLCIEAEKKPHWLVHTGVGKMLDSAGFHMTDHPVGDFALDVVETCETLQHVTLRLRDGRIVVLPVISKELLLEGPCP